MYGIPYLRGSRQFEVFCCINYMYPPIHLNHPSVIHHLQAQNEESSYEVWSSKILDLLIETTRYKCDKMHTSQWA